jgi:hypothetical protein
MNRAYVGHGHGRGQGALAAEHVGEAFVRFLNAEFEGFGGWKRWVYRRVETIRNEKEKEWWNDWCENFHLPARFRFGRITIKEKWENLPRENHKKSDVRFEPPIGSTRGSKFNAQTRAFEKLVLIFTFYIFSKNWEMRLLNTWSTM